MIAPTLIEVEDVQAIWPLVRPSVQRLVKRHPEDFSEEKLLADAKADIVRLWLAWEPDQRKALACVGVKVKIGEDGTLIGTGLFCDGRDRKLWQEETLRDVEAWFKLVGVQRVKILSRFGWGGFLKSMGYRATHALFEKELG